MPLCTACSLLTVDELDENDCVFHPNMAALKASASSGCNFCALAWETLKRRTEAPTMEKLLRGESAWPEGEPWTPRIWLRGCQLLGREDGAYIEVSVGKAYPHADDRWRDEDTNRHPTVSGRLELCETRGGRSKYRLRGRWFGADGRDDGYLTALRDWMAHCQTNHELCRLDVADEMPTRVLDLGDEANDHQVRLISTLGMREKYIALSYCWGPSSEGIPTLRAETHDAMRRNIAMADLAKTHREVMQLARALQIRYVWIDALCIIQGDAEDWERESVNMAQVYGNATLTVVAGRSPDSKMGFITSYMDSDLPPPCTIPADVSKDAPKMVVGMPRSQSIGPVGTRGWCFQERGICRRALIFGSGQFMFECATEYSCENGQTKRNDTHHLFRARFLKPGFMAKQPDIVSQAFKEQALRDWYSMLNYFLLCHFSDPHDIFVAMSAVAQRASAVLRCRYLAGLWEDDMPRGLLWRPRYPFQPPYRKCPATRPQPTRLTRETGDIIRAPSWSWAAVQGPVTQEYYTPTLIEKHRDPAYRMVRPKHTAPDRWTLDDRCGVRALRMPACELVFLGRPVKVDILKDSLKDYMARNPKLPRVFALARDLGVLLRDPNKQHTSSVDEGNFRHVVGAGFFDVMTEREGFQHVWCLLIVRNNGLILNKNADGSFSRLGTLLPESDEWFSQQDEVEVRLR